MKGERKLRLVTGGAGADPRDHEGDEPPFTDEEIAAAAALRDALEARDENGDPVLMALRAAHLPGPLAAADLDAIVTRAMGNEAAATDLERSAAERLRAELAGEAAASHASELLVALKMAAHPVDLPAARHAELIDAALARAPFLRRRLAPVRRIAPVTMAAMASVAALAAGLALFAGRVPGPRPPATAALARARSADDLFDAATPFPRRGEESARIDRIASARASDLRQNRFAAWGVK